MNDAGFRGLTPGETVDRYVVEAELGVGGVATVYRVRHQELFTVHALKVVHAAGRTHRDRLMEEGRLQATLRHPNIVPVTDVISVGGYPALLADFVGGGSLRSYLGPSPLELREAERIFRGILAGVAFAHGEDVVHRDLKPENILMDDSSLPRIPRVSDFGIARARSAQFSVGRLTRTGDVMGTPAYMAPEQARGLKLADHRSDLYSLGAILYELMTGAIAFGGGDRLDVLRATSAADYVPPQERRPEIPDRLARVVRNCLRPDPAERPPSCEALLALLDGRDAATAARRVNVRDTWDPEDLEGPRPQPTLVASGGSPGGGVALIALFTDVRGEGHAADLVVDRARVAGTFGPEDVSADARSAADIAFSVGTRGQGGLKGVRWQVRGENLRLSGESLGLAVALASWALARGRAVPAGWAVTGRVDLDGRVRPVEGIPAKLRAASAVGVGDVIVPDDRESLPAPSGVAVHRVGSFDEAVTLMFGASIA